MSLYIGKDNSGNGIIHATANEHSIATLKAGVTEDTLFHSDIPFIRIGKTYTLSRTYNEALPGAYTSNFSTAAQYWAFPSAMRTDMANGYTFIGLATLSDGSVVQINSDKFCAHLMVTRTYGGSTFPFGQLGHAQEYGGCPGNGLRFCFPNSTNISKYYNDNYYGGDDRNALWEHGGANSYVGGGGWMVNTNGVSSGGGNAPPYMTDRSRGVLALRCARGLNGPDIKLNDVYSGKSAGASSTPDISGIKFYRMEVKATSSGFNPVALSGSKPGEVYIDNNDLLTNGSDHLSGLDYIVFRGFYTDGAYSSEVIPGSIGIPGTAYHANNSLGGYPHGILPSYSHFLYTGAANLPGHRRPTPVLQGTRARVMAYGNFTGQQMTGLSGTITPTSAFNSTTSILGYLDMGVFEIASLPNVNQIELTNTKLRINNSVDVYSTSRQPAAVIAETRTLDINSARRSLSSTSMTSIREGRVYIGGGDNIHFMYSSRGVSTADLRIYNYWSYSGRSYTMDPPSDVINDVDLLPQLAALPNGKQMNIGTVIIECRDQRTPNQAATVGVAITLKYVNGYLELWTHADCYRTTSGTVTYEVPSISVNVLRLTSGL